MPLFENFWSLEIARGFKAFLRLEAGLTRGGTPGSGRSGGPAQQREIERLRAQLAEHNGASTGRVRPENLVWIFSSGRSGTTWLRDMMKDLPGNWGWEEPRVGTLFGGFYNSAGANQLKGRDFIVGEPHRGVWLNSIRNFVLDGAAARFPDMSEDDQLIIKEPNGSEGAPLLMQALPESRMIFLVRDPRDVVASTLDGAREGNWLYEQNQSGSWKQDREADTRPDEFIKGPARRYRQKVGKAKEAFDAHAGSKVMVRYEDMNEDALGCMRRIYSSLDMPVDDQRLQSVVRKHSWANISARKKGEGKFYRKASPGAWKQDLTPEQVEIVERITAPLLEEYYAKSND